MKLRSIEAAWTAAGTVAFIAGVLILATGRFGPGVVVLLACIVCLSGSLRAGRVARGTQRRRPRFRGSTRGR